MKKIIMTAAAVFALTFAANAQDMKFGLKGGVNFANLTGGDGHVSGRTSFHIGGFGQYKINEKFTFQPEILYSDQGAKEKTSGVDSGASYSAEATYKLAYLNIPLMAKYYVSDKFSLEAGPQIGFILSAKADYDVTVSYLGTTMSDSSTEDIKDMVNSVDFGLNLGVGYDFTKNISAGFRYNIGLSDVQKDLPDGVSAAKNSVMQLSLGYKF